MIEPLSKVTTVLQTWLLDERDKSPKRLVILCVSAIRCRGYISLGFSVLKTQWNKRTQQFRASRRISPFGL